MQTFFVASSSILIQINETGCMQLVIAYGFRFYWGDYLCFHESVTFTPSRMLINFDYLLNQHASLAYNLNISSKLAISSKLIIAERLSICSTRILSILFSMILTKFTTLTSISQLAVINNLILHMLINTRSFCWISGFIPLDCGLKSKNLLSKFSFWPRSRRRELKVSGKKEES